MTLVTCPIIRYHPAIIAQAAATVSLLSDGRFTLGLGAGERLNEHVVGKGWPAVDIRHEMLSEAVEVMRLLWAGGDLLALCDRASPGKRKIGQVALSYDADGARATEQAMRFAFGVPGWKVMSELPNPVNFEAAAGTVREEDITAAVACGPDPEVHLQAIRAYLDAGYDEVCVVQVADDVDGFFSFWEAELAPRLR